MKRIIAVLLLAVLWCAGTVYSAEFDENSANITNQYFPLSPGKVGIFNFYAPIPGSKCTEPACMKATGMVQYWDCVGTDVVDGVKCLRLNRVNRLNTHPDLPGSQVYYNVLFSDWYAQSTDGSVYLLQELKYHTPTKSSMVTLGAENAELHMMSEDDIALTLAFRTNVFVGDITLGATGLGTFKDCIKMTHSFHGDFYFAPGIGAVRHVDPNGAFNELVSWEFPLAVNNSRYDISGDHKTGLAEAVYALQVAAGMLSEPGDFTLSTNAFTNNEIPVKYTCKSTAPPVSPPLSWTNPPLGTKSFVLISDHLDSVPHTGYALDNWLVYDIPASQTGLAENEAANLPSGAKHGVNREGKEQYSGPCAPDSTGKNRYYFRLYALDIANLEPIQTNKIGIQAAMAGHVLGQTELVGTFTF